MKKYILMFLFLAMAITISAALAFEYIGGYVPCYLCLIQRIPYYVALTILSLCFAIYYFFGKNFILDIGLFVCLFAMLIVFAIAIYHSGVEWNWWQGPNACLVVAGNDNSNAATLLNDLATAKPPACNEASWRFLFLSFAGWNSLISLFLSLVAFVALFNKRFK